MTPRSTGPPDAGAQDAPIRFGAFELDMARFELRRDGRPLPLEPRTFDLLALLARNIGRTVTRDEIFQSVWKGQIVSESALSSQIKAARRALGDDGVAQQMIATIHGRGFRLRRQAGHDPEPVVPEGRSGTPTVVVLPCVSVEQDGRGAIIAQGMTEDIITALSRNRWLRVVSRSTAFALGTAEASRGEVAAKLGADYVVTGSVRRAGNRVRTTVQTIDARDNRCIWNERFDRDMTDIFELQEEISRLVASRIATELGIMEQERAARQPRRNLGTWELYQLGSAEFYRFTAESNRRSQRLLQQAIRQDPTFASPYSRLAYAMILEMVYFEGARDQSRLDEALDLARQGVACDDQDAQAFFSLGRVRLARREYELAIDALEQAIDLNPCLALSYCGLGDSLAYEGRLDEAIGQFETAISLSPHDPFRWAFMSYRALAHLFAHQFDDAAHWARRATQVPNAHYWANANLVAALGHLGDSRQVQEAAQALYTSCPGFSREFAEERLFFVKDRSQLRTLLDGLRRAGIG